MADGGRKHETIRPSKATQCGRFSIPEHIVDFPAHSQAISIPSCSLNVDFSTASKSKDLECDKGQNVGVIAASCRLPDGTETLSDLWDLLKTGRSTTSAIPSTRVATRDILLEGQKYGTPICGANFIAEDVSQFDNCFFDISESEAEGMDPQQRLLLECVEECIETAGARDLSHAGVFVGLMEKEYPDITENQSSISSMIGSMCAVVSGRISFIYNCHGPSLTVDTACSSSLVALDLAISALKDGKCSVAIVAGVSLIISEKGLGVRANGKMLSHHGMSASFDAHACGYGRSDGCVVLMIELMKPDVEYMSKIADVNVNHGGRSVSLTTPNLFAHRVLISSLLDSCASKNLQYWEAHGTGTKVGDPVEVNALSSVLKKATLGSAKASLGHGEASAGVSALLKLVLMLNNNYIPPTLHFRVINQQIDMGLLSLPIIGEDRLLNTCGLTSFGVSGTNAGVIVAHGSTKTDRLDELRTHYLIPISARSAKSLMRTVEEVSSFVLHSSEAMEDVVGALALRKNHYNYRCGLIVDRRARQIKRMLSTGLREQDYSTVVISKTDVSYDVLQIPRLHKHFQSIRGISHKDKLLLCFMQFVTHFLKVVQIHAQTSRELIAALMALSFLPKSLSSLRLQRLPSSKIEEALAKFDVTSSKNVVVRRYLRSSSSSVGSPRVLANYLKIPSVLNYCNLLVFSSQLYTKGFDLDFSWLYRRPSRSLEIPTYAFDKRRFWLAEISAFDHYLIGVIKEQTHSSITFSNWLNKMRHPHLFIRNSIGIGTVVEIVQAVFSHRDCSNVSVSDIKVDSLDLTSPCLLVTTLEGTGHLYTVQANLDQRPFFSCTVSAEKKREYSKTTENETAAHKLKRFGASRHPIYLPYLKNTSIIISEQHDFAAVDASLEASPYPAAVEISIYMLQGMTIASIHLLPGLPSSFEISKVTKRQTTTFLITSGDKVYMQLCSTGEASNIHHGTTAFKERYEHYATSLSRKHYYSWATNGMDSEFHSVRHEELEDKKKLQCGAMEVTTSLNTTTANELVRLILHALETTLHRTIERNERTLTTSFIDLGLDSLRIADFVNHFNQKGFLEIHLSTVDIFDYPTISQLADHIVTSSSANKVAVANPVSKLEFSKRAISIRNIPDKIVNNVINAIQDVLCEPIRIDNKALCTSFNDLGLDSLRIVDLVSRLNQNYFPEASLSTVDVFDYPTILQLSEHIAALLSANKVAVTNSIGFNGRAVLNEDTLGKIMNRVINAIQDVLSRPINIDDNMLTTSFYELGLDSLRLIDLVSRLNHKYFPKANISTVEVFDYPTILQLSQHIATLFPENHVIVVDSAKDSGPCDQTVSNKNPPTEITAIVIKAIQDILSGTIATDDNILTMSFNDLGLDSLRLTDFVSRLNKNYFPKANLSTVDVFDHPTILQLADHIATLSSPNSVSVKGSMEEPGAAKEVLSNFGTPYSIISSAADSVRNQKHTTASDRKMYKSAERSLALAKSTRKHATSLSDVQKRKTAVLFSTYVAALEIEDVTADYILTYSGHEYLKLTCLSQHDNVHAKCCTENILVHSIRQGSIIKFHSESAVHVKSLFSALLLFARQLISTGSQQQISVSNRPTLANSLARSFFKTIAAEKYPRIAYIYTERLTEFSIAKNHAYNHIHGNWLISGGLSGIGLTIARWLLFECSVSNIVLVSRRIPSGVLSQELDQLRTKGNVFVISADISDFQKLQSEFACVSFKLTGVIHCAGILRDQIMERQDASSFSQVFTPKGDGYLVLDRLLNLYHHNPDHFIVMSSFTALCGNVGQVNYGVANAYLDYQMYLRRMAGKAGTSIHWGNWLDTGMAMSLRKTLANQGFLGLANKEALECVKYAIVHKPIEFVAVKVNWDTVLEKRPDIRKDIVMRQAEEKHVSTGRAFKGTVAGSNRYSRLRTYNGERRLQRHQSLAKRAFKVLCSSKVRCTSFNTRNVSLRELHSAEVVFSAVGMDTLVAAVEHCSSPDSINVGLHRLSLRNREHCKCTKTVMIFAGHNPQCLSMTGQLLCRFPLFEYEFKRCLNIADELEAELFLESKFQNGGINSFLLPPRHREPTIFAFGYASAMLWQSLGFSPDFYLGFGVGEFVAGVVADILTLKEGIRLAVAFGAVLERACTSTNEMELNNCADVAVNPEHAVFFAEVSKPYKMITFKKLEGDGDLQWSAECSAQSLSLTQNEYEHLHKLLKAIVFREGRVPILSSSSGRLVTRFSAKHLLEHIKSTAKFKNCVEMLVELDATLWFVAGRSSAVAPLIERMSANGRELHDVAPSTIKEGKIKASSAISATFSKEQEVFVHKGSERCRNRNAVRSLIEVEAFLSPQEIEIVRGHHVNNVNLVPAAYNVYRLLVWLSASSPSEQCPSLTEVRFTAPWIYENSSKIMLARTRSSAKVVVNGKTVCTSRMCYESGPLLPCLNPANLSKECTVECDVNLFYRQIAANGLAYSSHFQIIKFLRRNDNCTYSILNFKQPFAIWTLFDAALHAVCFNVSHRRPDVYFVPIAVDKVYLNKTVDPRGAKSIVAVTNKVAENEKFIEAHGCVFVDDRLLFQYTGMHSMVLKAHSCVTLPRILQSSRNDIALEKHNHSHSIGVQAHSLESISDARKGGYVVGYDGKFCFDIADVQDLLEKMKIGLLWKEYKIRKSPSMFHALMDVDITEWDPSYFGVSPKEAVYIDVIQRLMMNSVSKCMESARWASVPKKTGVFIGVSGSDFNNRVYKEMNSEINGYFSTGSSASCVAGRIAHWLGCEGPAVVVDTACSSSFTALVCALDAINQGKCENAIVGGVNIILHDTVTKVLENLGVLSRREACRVFDAEADGYVRSEAVGCLLLSRNALDAKFKVSKWATGHNGDSGSLHTPNGISQERVMRALEEKDVSHVECHGTGTSLGDPVEIAAVSRIYDSATISSVKSLIGHTEAASGVVSLLSCLVQMRNNYRTAQMHFKSPNPQAKFNRLVVNSVGEEFNADLLVINNFGFSGTNCSVVLEKLAQPNVGKSSLYKYYLAPLSSKNKWSLDNYVKEFKKYVEVSDCAINDICTTLQKGKASYKYRHCILYDNSRRIVWETGQPIDNDEEFLCPLDLPHIIDFAYGSVLGCREKYRADDLLNFYRLALPNTTKASAYSIVGLTTSKRYHQFVANKYVKGFDPDWNAYNSDDMNDDVVMPSYMFKNESYWPFKEQFATNFGFSGRSFESKMYFEKTRIALPWRKRDYTVGVVLVGRKLNINNLAYVASSAFRISDFLPKSNKIVLYHPHGSSISDALELISLWQALESQKDFMLIVACKSNGTSLTEWTALCRTLASERLLSYKFVSFATSRHLETELCFEDEFECVFHEDSERYVERLVPLTLKRSAFPKVQHLLATGGTGGVGRKIIEFINPNRATVITRCAGKADHNLNGGRCSFIESDLCTLSLPDHEDFDVVLHCAGVVDNALMSSLDYSKFENVCKPKYTGIRSLLDALKGKSIKKLVVGSSVASVLGSVGQANYAFANGLMTSFLETLTVPSMLIHWGPWKDTGLLQGAHSEKVYKQLKDRGWNLLEPTAALSVLDSNATNVVVFDGDLARIAKTQEHLRKFLSKIVPIEVVPIQQPILHDKSHDSVVDKGLKLPCSAEVVEAIVISVSGVSRVSEEKHTALMNLGIDSLMLEQIRLKINEYFDYSFKSSEIYDNCTLKQLSNLIESRCKRQMNRAVAQTVENDQTARYSIKDNYCCLSDQQSSTADSCHIEESTPVMETMEDCPNSSLPEQSCVGCIDIAIIACSGSCSGSTTIDEYWSNLLAGKECITRAKTDENYVDAAGMVADIDKFDHNFWKMSHDDAAMLDPQLRLFLQNAYCALEKSGYIRVRSELKIGVFAGAEPSDYGDPNEEAEGSLRRLFKMNMKDFTSTFTAHMLDLRGPAVGVYSACSTALLALAQACYSLQLSKLDLAIAGGASIVLPGQTQYEYEEGFVLSKSGMSKPFDKTADGMVRGTVIGCVVLKRLDHAIRDNDNIEAVIKSFGLSNDGLQKASFMAPTTRGQQECMSDALSLLSDTDKKRIRYIECHGTGTLVGDEVELESLKNVYGNRKDLVIGSVKANIGHGYAGSGMAALFKVIKILQEEVIPPQINLQDIRCDIPFCINRSLMRFPSQSMAGMSSFGIGGTNVHMLLEKGPPPKLFKSSASTKYIFPISGASKEACVAQCRAIAKYIRDRHDISLEAIAATLQLKRDHFRFRAAFVIDSALDAVHQLEAFRQPTISTSIENANLCFFFAPQGAQYANMEKESMMIAPMFKSEMKRLTNTASVVFQTNFEDVMYPKDTKNLTLISEAKFSQVAVFVICKAVLAQLENWGISSNFLLGHSVGEYVAAHYAGILDEISCIGLLRERGELVSTTRAARMLVVPHYHKAMPSDVETSAHLSDTLQCVVGPPSVIEALREKLQKDQIECHELTTKHGFHSSMMDEIRVRFQEVLKKYTFREGFKKLVSNVDGRIISKFDSSYCWLHMRRPVDLKRSLDTVLSNKDVKVIVEIGPSGIIRQLLADRSANVHVVSTVLPRRKGAEHPLHSQLLQAVADLWSLGYEVDFTKVFPSKMFDPKLPTYQFDRISCWKEKYGSRHACYYEVSWSYTKCNRKSDAPLQDVRLLVISNVNSFVVCERLTFQAFSLRPCELFAFDASELQMFTLIIYIPEDYLSEAAEPYLLSHKVCKAITSYPTRFAVVSVTGNPNHWTTIGPIKQMHLGRERKNVFVDNLSKMPLKLLVPQLLINQEEVLRKSSDGLFRIAYVEATSSSSRVDLGKTVLVIGGCGAIGSVYVEILKRMSEVDNIVITSRTQKHSSLTRVSHIKMDLCSEPSIESALNDVQRKYGNIHTIVHAAGIPTSASLLKSTGEMLSVLQPKVLGLMSILKYFSRNNLMLQNLIITSSLTSTVTLQGTEDYAASNVFLDALALKGHPNVDRILSIQWPPWQAVGMAATYEKDSLESVLSKISISPHTGKRVARETLDMSGVITYAHTSPSKLSKIAERMQFQGSSYTPAPPAKQPHTLLDKVMMVWSEVLGTDVNSTSNFFEIGGNSLNALRVVWSVNKLLDVNVPVDLLFQYPSPKEFAKALPWNMNSKTFRIPEKTSQAYPAGMTYAQENMYLLWQLEAGSRYNIIFSVFFRERKRSFSSATLMYTVQSLIARQHALRTTFSEGGASSEPKQVVMSLTECYQHVILENEVVYETLIKEEESYHFKQDSIPLRIVGGKVEDDVVLVFNQHHILTDGWSMTILAGELENIYSSYSDNKDNRVLPLSFSLSDYANEQRRTVTYSEQLAALKAALENTEPTVLPQKRSLRGPSEYRRIAQILPEKVLSAVRSLAKHNHTTEFVVMLSAFSFTIRRLKCKSHENSIVIGYPVAGRSDEVKDLLGYFLNNVVLSIDVQLEDELKEVIEVVKKAVSELRKYEDVPFHKLVSVLGNDKRHPDEHPVFQIFFNYRHQLDYPRIDLQHAKVEVEQISVNRIFDLSMTFDEVPDGTRMLLEYNAGAYRTDVMWDLIRGMLRCLTNDTPLCVPRDITLVDCPSAVICKRLASAQWRNDRAAIRKSTSAISFQSLYSGISATTEWINDSWIKITGCSIRCDDVICLDVTSNNAVLLVLSVVKLGAAYAPIGHTWPTLRKSQAIENVDSPLCITESMIGAIPQRKRRKRRMEMNRSSDTDMVYVIHTSGSAGSPKGVAVSHKNVGAFLLGCTQQTLLRPGLRVSHSVNVAFDVSFLNIFGTVVNNGELCVHADLRELPSDLKKIKCDLAFVTSAMLNAFTERELRDILELEKLFVGGDSIHDRNLLRLLESNLDVTQIYGPTEGTVWSLTNRCKLLPGEGCKIGKPMLNESCWVIHQLKEGELILAGDKVARGYYNIRDSGKFFVENGLRCYRTGDVVVCERESFYYRGRLDSQLKVRGHRVESEEVEQTLLACSTEIAVVKVVAVEDKLVAFIVSDEAPDAGRISLKMHTLLPPYMVPSRFIRIEVMPLNISGKVDTAKLLEEYGKTKETSPTSSRPLMSLTEHKIASIFAKLLNVKDVTSGDNFYILGGHSLLLYKLKASLVDTFNVELNIHEISNNLTVGELAILVTKPLRNILPCNDTSPIFTLRNSLRPKFNVYFIHAIGGSITPYYSFLRIFPEDVNLYAIEYRQYAEVTSIKQLAALYAKMVASHTGAVRPFLMGHSLGGTICREMVPEMRLWGWEIPFVVMFDTWVVQQGQLVIERVSAFAKKAFQSLPDGDIRTQNMIGLAKMLDNHVMAVSTTKIHLFKSMEVGSEALRKALRSDPTETLSRAVTSNGLDSTSTQPIETWLINGSHETCMKLENLITHKETILSIFERWR